MPELSVSQKNAVTHHRGPALVLAGPGSGKTQVITHRVLALIHKYHADPRQILVITFSKAAAVSMRQRFHALSGGVDYPVTFGTFHAVFFHILKQAYHYDTAAVLQEGERRRILSELAYRYHLEGEDRQKLIRDLSAGISRMAGKSSTSSEIDDSCCFPVPGCPEEVCRSIFADYRKIKQQNGRIDFDDMLLRTRELFFRHGDILSFWQKKFSWILIDEFQDINPVQYEIIRMLAGPENNLFAVGDDDQSIYRFRGAKPQIMLGFTRDYPDAVLLRLQENYRCPEEVVSLSGRLIAHNKDRFSKKIHAVSKQGAVRTGAEPVQILRLPDHAAQSLFIVREIRNLLEGGAAASDIAVITRTNTGGRYILERLVEFGIPVCVKDAATLLYDHWIAEDILSYIRLGLGGRDRRDLLQIMNRPGRYISRECLDRPTVSFDRLRMWYEDRDRMLGRIDRLEEELMVLGRMTPYAAVNFIRKGIEYDAFLEEYAARRRLNVQELFEIADEIQDQAKAFGTYEEWSAHIDKCRDKQERDRQRNKEGSAGIQSGRKEDGVLLATIHSVKGLEFDTVFIPDLNEGMLPYAKAGEGEEVEEERRLLYVGMTRTKQQLYLLYVRERFGRPQQPSRFIAEITGKRN